MVMKKKKKRRERINERRDGGDNKVFLTLTEGRSWDNEEYSSSSLPLILILLDVLGSSINNTKK